jgi:toxin ParE1/3/4
MSGRIIRRPEACQDIIELASYILNDSLDAAERFVTAVEEEFQKLFMMPGMGSRRRHGRKEFSDLRMWPITGFREHLIFYREIPEGIEIVRVLHGRRHLSKIFEE